MLAVIVLFDRFTALDAVGPYEVLSSLPGAEVVFAAQTPGPVVNEKGTLHLMADAALADVPRPDVIVISGGPGQNAHMADEALLGWLRAADSRSAWTTSVCTGSLLLAAAGLLRGRRAACHWAWRELLADFGVTPDPARIVRDGNIVTGGGVTAGIDMALAVMAQIAGVDYAETVQLALEYSPEPPFDSGRPERARPEIVAAALRRLDGIRVERSAAVGRAADRTLKALPA